MGGSSNDLVEQAELLLLGEHAQDRAIDEGLVDSAVAHGGGERLEEGVAGRQLDVDAGGEGELGRVSEVGRDLVHGVQERYREVVGDDDAVEAPLVAEDAGEQLFRCRATGTPSISAYEFMTERAPPSRIAISNGGSRTSASSRGPSMHRRVSCARPATPSSRRSASAWRATPASCEPADVRGADRADDVRVFGDASRRRGPSADRG